MNRQERLHRELPDELKDRAPELAVLPTTQVDLIIGAMLLSRREGRAIEKQARKRRREAKRNGTHAETDRVGEAVIELIRSLGCREADGDLIKLLSRIGDEVDAARVQAIDGLRRAGVPWSAIAAEAGTSKQALSQWRLRRQGRPAVNGSLTRDAAPETGVARSG